MTVPLRALSAAVGASRNNVNTASKPVVSGVSLVLATVGALMIVAGTHRSPIVDVLKAAVKNQPIPRNLWDQDPTLRSSISGAGAPATTVANLSSGGSAMGRSVAAQAITYVGRVPYVWAGATPEGWDCSGFVTWLLHHDFGLNLPSNTHTTTGGFLLWSDATNIPKGQEQVGDLVIWPVQAIFPDGHMGIVTGPGTMVAAADPKQGTINDTYNVGLPVFRRPNAYGAAGGSGGVTVV